MDIARSANPEPPVEPSDRQETLSLPQNTGPASGEAETFIGPDTPEQSAEEAETPLALEHAAAASAGAALQISPDTAEPSAEDVVILHETEGTAPLVRMSASDAGDVVRTKSRYSPWLQIIGAVLLVCLVGGVVLAVGRPGGALTPAPEAHRLPTPVLPLKVTAWCPAGSAAVDPRLGEVHLVKVVALATSDVWMLGETSNDNAGRTFPLLEHWNGATWSVLPTADTSALLKQLVNRAGKGKTSETVSLSDMAVLSERDIWAVGSASVSVVSSQVTISGGSPVMFVPRSGKPLIEHWDGRTWQIVASPGGFTGNPAMPDLSTNTLTRISAVSATDIWAIGSQMSRDEQTITVNGQSFKLTFGGPPVPLVEHWDGKSWTERKLPASLAKSTFFTLNNIQAFSSNDVWSFGTSILGFAMFEPGTQPRKVVSPVFVPPAGTGVSLLSYLLHWDGQSWMKVKLPETNVSLRDVHIISGHDIWLITDNGLLGGKSGSLLNMVYHWDGTTWNKVPEVNSADPGSVLDSFSVSAPDNVWLLGHTGKNRPLLEHWDGKSWSPVSLTTPAYGSVQSMVVAGKRAWAVVSVYDAKSAQKAGSSIFVAPSGSMLETNC
jgi:hypothetical protein